MMNMSSVYDECLDSILIGIVSNVITVCQNIFFVATRILKRCQNIFVPDYFVVILKKCVNFSHKIMCLRSAAISFRVNIVY